VKLLWKPTDSLSVLVGFIADNNLANSGGLCENIVLTLQTAHTNAKTDRSAQASITTVNTGAI